MSDQRRPTPGTTRFRLRLLTGGLTPLLQLGDHPPRTQNPLRLITQIHRLLSGDDTIIDRQLQHACSQPMIQKSPAQKRLRHCVSPSGYCTHIQQSGQQIAGNHHGAENNIIQFPATGPDDDPAGPAAAMLPPRPALRRAA